MVEAVMGPMVARLMAVWPAVVPAVLIMSIKPVPAAAVAGPVIMAVVAAVVLIIQTVMPPAAAAAGPAIRLPVLLQLLTLPVVARAQVIPETRIGMVPAKVEVAAQGPLPGPAVATG